MSTTTQFSNRTPGSGATQIAPGSNISSPTTLAKFGQGAGGNGNNLRGAGGRRLVRWRYGR